MRLSCFPEFNQSITLSNLCYLPPELPPYRNGKLGNKTAVPLRYCSRDRGEAFIITKVGSGGGFQSFIAKEN